MDTIFKSFLVCLEKGIEPRSTDCEADARTITPLRQSQIQAIEKQKVDGGTCFGVIRFFGNSGNVEVLIGLEIVFSFGKARFKFKPKFE